MKKTQTASKLSDRDEAAAKVAAWKKKKKTVGYTSGVFDILHPGHVDYLQRAAAICDYLVVGINSDSSVRTIKGEGRPICSEGERAAVVAGLESVALVFIFSEANNNKNVELLQPDLYIKAGDYSRAGLSSASIVEAYGGRVQLVSFKEGFSSSSIIKKIEDGACRAVTISTELPPYERRPAVFFDRDGTINEHVEYLHEESRLRIIPGAFEGMKKLRDAGFRIVIVTNQPGIGIGYFTKEDFFAVNRAMLRLASSSGVNIDRIYFCPHSRADNCDCRKPAPGMIKRAVADLNLDIAESFLVGDMSSDIKLARETGCKAVLVETGMGGKDGLFKVNPDHVAANLGSAADWILTTLRR